MKTIKNFDWIVNIFNEVLIVDKDYKVIYCGAEIRNTLFSHQKKCSENFLKNFKTEWGKEAIKKKIDSVWQSNSADSLQLKESEKTLFIFPAIFNNVTRIIISTNEDIILKSKMSLDLKERIKELECLYNISSEIEMADDLDQAFKKSIFHLINGFQYPEITTAKIIIDKISYGFEDCLNNDAEFILSQDILVNGKYRGQINVCSQQKHNFLDEEKKLLREISIMIAKAMERKDQIKDAEHKRKLLSLKNKKLLEMTEECGESRKRLETLFHAISDTILLIDSDFQIEMSNRNDEQNSAKCFQRFFHLDHPCPGCPAISTFETKKDATANFEMDGEFYQLNTYPINNDEGEVDRVLELIRNVSNDKKLEDQLMQTDKLASLGKLVSGIAHEINNPNTFILGNMKIIKEAFEGIIPILDDLSKQQEDLKIARLNFNVFKENIPVLVDDMLNGAVRIKKIVEDLRNFARKDEGVLEDEVNINDVAANSIRLAENQIKRNSKIRMELQSDLPKVAGSMSKLEQVVLNMLFNSNQAIEGNVGKILVQTEFDEKKDEVIIRISDNGPGMDEKTMKSIFDPFFTTMRSAGGTGLGLAISYGIIKEHKGRIEVESKVNEGATFIIYLPALSGEPA